MIILMPDARFDGPADLEQKVFDEFHTAGAEIHAFQAKSLDDIPNEIWQAAEGLMVWGSLHCDKAMLDKATNCKMVIRMGVGYDVVDIEQAGKRGIPVCNVPDYGTTDVADHAIGLMLSLTRGIVRHHTALVNNETTNMSKSWRAIIDDTPPIVVRRVRGATFGIVGCGRIGTATGLRAKALGMHVVFYDPYLPDGSDQAVGFERRETLHDLLQDCDIVSLHTPLTKTTQNMINQDTISNMKNDAILINTSRGSVVDIHAITCALKQNRIGAVGLDVQPVEPPDLNHNPLMRALWRGEEWTVGRVIVTPHAAWYSPDGLVDCRQKAARTVINFLTKGILRNCVNEEFLVKNKTH